MIAFFVIFIIFGSLEFFKIKSLNSTRDLVLYIVLLAFALSLAILKFLIIPDKSFISLVYGSNI